MPAEYSSKDRLIKWYGIEPATPDEFTSLAQVEALLWRLGEWGNGAWDSIGLSLRAGLDTVELSINSLISTTQEHSAAELLRQFFGEPNEEYLGAHKVAANLETKEEKTSLQLRYEAITKQFEVNKLLSQIEMAILFLMNELELAIEKKAEALLIKRELVADHSSENKAAQRGVKVTTRAEEKKDREIGVIKQSVLTLKTFKLFFGKTVRKVGELVRETVIVNDLDPKLAVSA